MPPRALFLVNWDSPRISSDSFPYFGPHQRTQTRSTSLAGARFLGVPAADWISWLGLPWWSLGSARGGVRGDEQACVGAPAPAEVVVAVGGAVVRARVMRPSAFLAARGGDGSPPLPFPLSPRHAPHRGSVLSGCSLPFLVSCPWLRASQLFFKRQSNSDLPLIACCIGLVFLAAIVLGRLWRRFIGVAASAPLFVLFNVLLLWGVYVFVIRRGELLEQCVQCIGRMPIVILDAIDCCGYMLFLSCCIDLSKADKVSWFRWVVGLALFAWVPYNWIF